MEWMSRWDIALALVAGYVAVMAMVRMMLRRRDQDVADVERQIDSLRKQSRNKRGTKNRDAA